jgi:hypothetical protein
MSGLLSLLLLFQHHLCARFFPKVAMAWKHSMLMYFILKMKTVFCIFMSVLYHIVFFYFKNIKQKIINQTFNKHSQHKNSSQLFLSFFSSTKQNTST